MPKDTNPVLVISNENSGTDIAGNVINPANNGVILPNTQSTSVDTTNPNPKGEGGNDVPLLITPVIEAPNFPKGSGGSVVVEPELGTPIVKELPAEEPKSTQTTPSSPISNWVNNLPPFLGGGGGAGGGGAEATDSTGGTPTAKKKNYVLYIGILLALIVTYKVLSKKEK
jgi:hypothetical protein